MITTYYGIEKEKVETRVIEEEKRKNRREAREGKRRVKEK